MSVLENQIIQSVYGLPDESLKKILIFIQNLLNEEKKNSIDRSCMTQSGIQRIGIAKNEKFFADGYDLDDFDNGLAEMFGMDD